MTRHQRQLDELRALCRAGRIGRAVDLAFEHFATFGRDGQVVAALLDALEHGCASEDVRERFAVLCGDAAAHDAGPAPPDGG
jgi:hypothetical protein